MKLYEKMARDNAQRYKKVWDNFIIAADSYLQGFKAAKALSTDGSEVVEVSFEEGNHQLGNVRDKVSKERIEEAFGAFFDCEITDLRFHKDKDVVSIQMVVRDKNEVV